MIMASSKIFLLFFFITFLQSPTTQAQTYISHNCSLNNTIAANSTFQLNRIALFSSLASANTDFYNNTIAGGGDTIVKDGDPAYGLFMCRGDVNLTICQRCVLYAIQRLTIECTISKEAIIWFDECLLRYSNHFFFSTFDTRPRASLLNPGIVSNQASSMRILYHTMNKTADEAATPAMGKKKYATTGTVNISVFQTVYCQAQCTPNLSPSDCRKCLSGVIGDLDWCCYGKQGERVLYPSCNIRFELYPFYNSDDQPTPAALSPTNSSGLQGKVQLN